MQTTQPISLEGLHEIVSAVFAQGPVVVKQWYSDFDCPPKDFADIKAMTDDLRYQRGERTVFRDYTIYYPEAKGRIYQKKIVLDPESCDGHTFRFCLEGWGLIRLHCEFQKYPTIECQIVVDSKARARVWSDTCPELDNPECWDWAIVNKKAGSLIRLLRKLRKPGRTSG
jgi:hypothetical protein